jgi:hypothetical protein
MLRQAARPVKENVCLLKAIQGGRARFDQVPRSRHTPALCVQVPTGDIAYPCFAKLGAGRTFVIADLNRVSHARTGALGTAKVIALNPLDTIPSIMSCAIGSEAGGVRVWRLRHGEGGPERPPAPPRCAAAFTPHRPPSRVCLGCRFRTQVRHDSLLCIEGPGRVNRQRRRLTSQNSAPTTALRCIRGRLFSTVGFPWEERCPYQTIGR